MHYTIFVSVVLAALTAQSSAFCVLPNHVARPSTFMNLFGNLGDAFKNDDSLGKKENAGLKGVS